MTTDDLPPGQPAATHRTSRGVTRLLSLILLTAASAPVWAQQHAPGADPVQAGSQDTPAATANAEAAPREAAKPAPLSIKQKAAEAATATLTALLPRLAASDSLPLLDRSTMVAGDLSRLLAGYDLSQEGVVKDEGGKIQAVLKRALTLMGTPYAGAHLAGQRFRLQRPGRLRVPHRAGHRTAARLPRHGLAGRRRADRQPRRAQAGRPGVLRSQGRINHVGIYVGEGRFLHSPSAGRTSAWTA